VAQEHPDRGFYGSLNYMYVEDDYTTSSTNTSKQNFLQEYKLGYKGNIYSPRLLEYTIEGLLRFDNEEIQRDGYSSKEKLKGEDYMANLNFIKETKFPFTLYANKSERPINTVYDTYSTNYVYETRGEGATGSINFEPYMLTYGATTTKTIAEFSDRLQNSKTTTYNGSFRYNENSHNVQANYSHAILENEFNYINDAATSVNQVKDIFNISHNWKATEDLTVTSGATYENDEFYSSEQMSANVDLFWKPKDADYDAYLSLYGSNLEYAGINGGEDYVFNSLNINQMFNYKLTEDILLSESAMVYLYDATTVKGSNANINLYGTHNYSKTIFEDIPFTLTSRLGVQKNESEYTTTTPIESSTNSTSEERYDIYITARAKKELPSINSNLNLNSGYYHSISSTKRVEQRYDFGLYFLTKLFSIVNNNITARYFQTNTSSVSELDGEKTKNINSTTSIMEMVNVYFNLGARGRASFGAGAEYISMRNDNSTTNRLDPRAEANFNYRLFQNWTFSSNARISEMYNTLEHSGSANLNFKAGKTTFLMGYQYNKSEIDSVFRTIQNERSIFRVQLTRTF
jgi:hypothetical protein